MGRCLLSLLLVSSFARAAFEDTPRGARAVGLGGATVSLQDLWAPFINPACLPGVRGTIVAAEYLPGIFGLREIKRGALSVSRTLSVGTLGLTLSGLGFDLYQEVRAGVAARRELNSRVILGFGLNYYSLAIRGYGSDQAAGFDVGALLHITPAVSYGVAFHNVNRPSMGDGAEPLPQWMAMGVSVRPLSGALVSVSAEKDNHYPFELSVGVEYAIEDLVAFRIGANSEPSTVTAGIGIYTSLLTLDYAYAMHPDLGGTHCISVSFCLPWP